MGPRTATQEFAIRNILVKHTNQKLSPALIDRIVDEIAKEMKSGPCSWAFKETARKEVEK
jgi:hypothetical protein